MDSISLRCSSDKGWYSSYVEIFEKSFWQEEMLCPEGYKIVGLKTRVDLEKSNDFTSISGVEMKCAEIPPQN